MLMLMPFEAASVSVDVVHAGSNALEYDENILPLPEADADLTTTVRDV